MRASVSVSAAFNKVARLLSTPAPERLRAPPRKSRENERRLPLCVGSRRACVVRGRGFAVMARTLLQRYLDIPDGTECHRKTYASTTISGAAGERRPGPEGRGCREVIESLGAVPGRWGSRRWCKVVAGVSRAAMGCWGALVRERLWRGVGLIQRAQGGHGVTGSCRRGWQERWVSHGVTRVVVGVSEAALRNSCVKEVRQGWRPPGSVRVTGWPLGSSEAVAGGGGGTRIWGLLLNPQALEKSLSGRRPFLRSKELGIQES